ncbi:hypothetical protein [Mycobacterium spongiae]|uniref:hypothetical protein n=1 Tax=Mycobacterium spongiae TaxID=886343 RepID=UPI002484B812|nr:hypothetical protein [Mycobacterium spongiae]
MAFPGSVGGDGGRGAWIGNGGNGGSGGAGVDPAPAGVGGNAQLIGNAAMAGPGPVVSRPRLVGPEAAVANCLVTRVRPAHPAENADNSALRHLESASC